MGRVLSERASGSVWLPGAAAVEALVGGCQEIEAVRAAPISITVGALSPHAPPCPLSSFVGRDQEIEQLCALLGSERLLTLTGPGGSGKTRLALELSARIAPNFDDGLGLVDLAPIRDPLAVQESVAAALGLTLGAARNITTLIGPARLLLVIDNAEHLVETVSTLAGSYLAGCPNLHILVTSRERLNVDGEVTWQVLPLPLPPRDSVRDAAAIGSYDAIKLFSARAREHEPAFRLSDSNAESVARICMRLDGIPLAIELAAARVRSLGLANILDRLDDSLGLLTGGRRSADGRQQSLAATIEWSYQLLDEHEQRLLRRLSVFAGTFDLRSIEEVCSAPDLPFSGIADTLHRLVEKSLVTTFPRPAGNLRYGQLEVIRQYARERLLSAGESTFAGRHAGHYARLLSELSTSGLDMDDPVQKDFDLRIERMTDEDNNLKLALEWSTCNDPVRALAMLEDQHWFWILRGSVREACEQHNSVLAVEHRAGPRLTLVHAWAAKWSWLAGNLASAATHIERAEALCEPGDSKGAISIQMMRGILAAEVDGDLAIAEQHFLLSVALCEECLETTAEETPGPRESGQLSGIRQDLATSLNNLAMTYLLTDRCEQAVSTVQRALDYLAMVPQWRQAILIASFLHTYGSALLANGHREDASEQFLRALSHAAHNGNNQAALHALLGLAGTACSSGDHISGMTFFGAARRAALNAGASANSTWASASSEAELKSRAALGAHAATVAFERGLGMDLQVASAFAEANRTVPSRTLAPRKLQITKLVAQGFSDKEIAQTLRVSRRTVEAHLLQLRHRLGFRNRAQVAAWAAAQGLIEG